MSPTVTSHRGDDIAFGAVSTEEPVSSADSLAEHPASVEMPPPRNYQAILLAGILALLLTYSLYLAREIAIPVVFAVVLQFAAELGLTKNERRSYLELLLAAREGKKP